MGEASGWEPGQDELVARRRADLSAQRAAEDEELIREFVRTHGSRDVNGLRRWVAHVRGDIGPRGVITELSEKPNEWAAVYYTEPEGTPAAAPAPGGTTLALQDLVGRTVAPAGPSVQLAGGRATRSGSAEGL